MRNLGGTHSPLILVQTRCERPEDEKPSPPIDSSKLDFTYVKSCTYSARVDRGRATLDDAISQAVEYLQKNEGIASIGKGRMAVLRQLQDWRKQDQERLPEEREHRTLSYKEFEALCEQKGGVRSAASLLDYLHQIGALFFKKELFDGRIILDQSWALDAIYTVFDREHAYQHLCRQHGRFTRDLLEILVWGDYSQDEQKLFLSLMQSCGICFIHKPEDKRHGVEAEYIAPDLLPDKQGVADRLVGRWDDKEPFVEVCYHYRFLHPGIIRSLLSEIGKHAQTAAEYWKYGAWLFDARSNARALVEQTMQVTGEGEIRFQVQNDRNGELTKWLREKLEELNQRSSSYQPVIGIDGQQSPTRADERVQKRIPIEEEPESDKTRARDHIEDAPETSTPNFGPLPRSQTSQPRIFVSYAWDDPEPEGKHREAVVDQLCQAMQERGIEIIRDKTHLKLGESVREFMDQIADGDFIVAVISDKYLRSSYCMYELFQIYRRCADNPKRFNHKLIPLILQDAQISDLPSSAQYVQVWKKQKEQLDQVMKEIGHDYLDEATIREYRLINEFGHNVLPILHLLRDRMIPRDLDRMAEEGFQEVLKLTGLA